MTTIYAKVENEHIVISKRPLIASGGVQQCRVVFTFSDYWNGLTLAAIFADRQKQNVYRVLVEEDGSAVIPWEVLSEKGAFWMGVEGVDGTVRYTSEMIRYSIVEGAREGGDPEPPTPGIYDQLLDSIGKIDEIETDVGELGDKVEELGDKIEEVDGNGDCIKAIGRFASFDSVNGLTIGTNSVNVSATALIYNQKDFSYHTFQHDFAIPIAESGQVKPVILPDGKRFGFMLSDSITSSLSNLSQQYSTLSSTLNSNVQKTESLESSVSQMQETLEALENGYTDGVPDYYRSVLAEKEAKIIDALNAAGRNRAAFIFFADPHWDSNQKHSPALVRHILEHTPIKTVVCGGDILADTVVEKDDAVATLVDWQNAFRFCQDKLYCVVGDRDRNATLPILSSSATTLSEKETYSLLQSGMDSQGVTYGEYFYYYFDNAVEKTRYIFLDTGRKSLTQECAYFLTGALNALPENWHCIILSHLYWTCTDPSDPATATVQTAVTGLLNPLIDAYNARSSGTVTNSGTTVSYDFTDAKGTVTACVGGHLNFDKNDATAGGIPILMFDCDGTDTLSGIPATAGTVNEQAVTVVIADYSSHKIHCIRIGRGNDQTLTIAT